jgi:hypothetical protein
MANREVTLTKRIRTSAGIRFCPNRLGFELSRDKHRKQEPRWVLSL